MITMDHRGCVLAFNPAAEIIFGYREEETLGREMASLIIPPSAREPHRRGLARYLDTREPVVSGKRIELTAMRSDGSEFPAELAIAVIERGERPVFLGFLRDISARQRTEEELRTLSRLAATIGTLLAGTLEMREMLDRCAALLVERLGTALARIWLLNEKEDVLELTSSAGIYTHLDGAHARIPVGQFKIGLIARERKPHLTNAVVGDPRVTDQEWARREGMTAFAGYPLMVGDRLEGVLGLFSRSQLSEAAHLSLSSVSDGIALAIERKRNDRELRASEDRTRQVLESITDAFIAVDAEWRFAYVNRRAEQLLGRSRDTLSAKNLWREFPALIGTPFEENYREAVATSRKTSFQAYFAPLDLWAEVHAYPYDGGLAIYFQDIGERRRFDEKLRQSAKLEGLGVMAGGIAHDFNNLLTGILGNASLLTEMVPGDLIPIAEDIVKASERAADLTRQMLAFAGKGRFQLKRMNLSVEVREILRIIRSSVCVNTTVRLELAEELPVFEGDPSQIQQLVMNLALNASEALEGSPGVVTIRTRVEDVDETYIARALGAGGISPGRYIGLEVEDTGIGMSEETLARIFDPFFTTKFAGRGLGLAATLGIVQGHKGGINVQSTVGKGTTFKIVLPAASADEVD